MNEFSMAGLIAIILLVFVSWYLFSEPLGAFIGRLRGTNVVSEESQTETQLSLSDIIDNDEIIQDDIESFERSQCNNVNKYENYTIVDGCDDEDVYVKIFSDEEGYMMSFCSDIQNPKNRFLKLTNYSFGFTCLDDNSDTELISEREIKIGTVTTYDICGRIILFLDNDCMFGVG